MKRRLILLACALLSLAGALSVGVRGAEAGRCVTQCVDEGGGVLCCRRCCEKGGVLVCPDIFVCP